MTALGDLFSDSLLIDATASQENRIDFPRVPAKGAVYLLVNRDDAGIERPMLLATVGDLRAALQRRLSDTPIDVKSKRIAYGTVCTRVYWRIVHSSFAANYFYGQAAHALFPATARALIPWRDSWWIAVEREPGATQFPRIRKTNDLDDPALAYAGPVRDKHVAARLIESLEDLFDLCRYHNILVQAPHGRACAYKEMGKCPAPCDGSESLASYRRRVDAAMAFAADENRTAWRDALEREMKGAAAALEFEKAGRLKQRLTRAGLLQNEALAHLGRLEDFAFLTLQPGKGKPWIEPWIVARGRITPLPQFNVKDAENAAPSLAEQCAKTLARPALTTQDDAGTEAIALAAHHLFKGDADHGIWLRAALIAANGPPAILKAIEELRARKAPKPLAERSSDVETAAPVEAEATPGDAAEAAEPKV